MKLGRFLAALVLLCAFTAPVSAASLLPNGKQQIVDSNGAPCVGCKLYFYIPETTTPKDTWQDSDQTILNTNPVVLDDLGTAIIYGTGTYRQILKDASGTTLWDAITADSVSLNSSWAGISSGSANAQIVTLNNFSLEDGQLVYFLAGISNTGATTLNVSGTGAVSVVLDTSTGPQALGGGEITVGNVVGVVYSATTGTFHIVTPTPIQSFNGAVFFNGVITPTTLAADTNDWTPPGGFSTANTVRVQSVAAIKITGITGGASGRTFFLKNVGSYAITLTANSAASASGNRFLLAAPVILRPNDSVILQYDGLNNGWTQLQQSIAQPVAASFKNLTVQNGGTPNNQIVATADAVTLENAAGNAVRRLSINCTADVTTSGAGGLDTGSVTTTTWYSYWVIYNPATNTDSCLLSTSSTFSGLTLPSGYTFAARVSWNKTNGSSQFLRVLQKGRRAQYVISASQALVLMDSGTKGTPGSGTWQSVSVTPYVPTTASVIWVGLTSNLSGASSSSVYAVPNNTYGSQTSATPPILSSANSAPASSDMILESTSIYWASSAAGGGIWCIGWEDNI